MKKFFIIPLLILYLLAVPGVMVHLHYCGQALQSWSINAGSKGCEESGCDKDIARKDNCCKDEVISSKVSEHQHLAQGFKKYFSVEEFPAFPPQNYWVFDETAVRISEKSEAYRSNAPPGLWQDIPLYKLHSRLVYYG